MKRYIEEKELSERIQKNCDRLQEPYYQIEEVFDIDSDWPGDKPGRALLAFVSHYKMTGYKIPCMDEMMEQIPEATKGSMFFGEPTGDVIHEQQLSGHSWYLRGLCEYYEQFQDERALAYLRATVEGIYLPMKGKVHTYPIERQYDDGGVSGHSYAETDGWILSTDVGCAFMSLDGLSHYYSITKDAEVRALLDEMTDVFVGIDKCLIRAQTHCTLTAGRAMIRMYQVTQDRKYLNIGKDICDLYLDKGMTYTYQNFNWFGAGDTWTEPCGIVDSLMLALEVYKLTSDMSYRTVAARIYHNGLATAQRPNGGAGTDSTVSDTTSDLVMDGYEAPFCCTMRLAEGLWYVKENRELLYAEVTGKLMRDEHGRYFDGDILYTKVSEEAEPYMQDVRDTEVGKLCPIISYYKLANEKTCRSIKQKIII